MTDQTQENSENEQAPVTDELSMLKARAKLMGITHSNNISLEKLKEKIEAKLAGEAEEQQDPDTELDEDEQEDAQPVIGLTADLSASAPSGAPVAQATRPARKLTALEREQQVRNELHKTAMAMVRCRITNMNPAKKDLNGEIISVGNKYIGTVRKFVPFGEATDDGFHIPRVLYDDLIDRKYQQINVKRDPKTGTNRVTTRWVREFAIEVLPTLTQEELDRLAIAQAAAGSIDHDAAV
jgi:hypothetical protein